MIRFENVSKIYKGDVVALSLGQAQGNPLPTIVQVTEASKIDPAAHPEIAHEGIAPDFMQSMIPKLDANTLAPVSWPPAPALEWCPPGHRDVYGALADAFAPDVPGERPPRNAKGAAVPE